jgi:hypothetical protein
VDSRAVWSVFLAGRRIRLPATNVSYRDTEHLRVLIANAKFGDSRAAEVQR